jgi:hypothetical protein
VDLRGGLLASAGGYTIKASGNNGFSRQEHWDAVAFDYDWGYLIQNSGIVLGRRKCRRPGLQSKQLCFVNIGWYNLVTIHRKTH